MLAGHEKCDHDVCDFVVLESFTGTVLLVQESRDHVVVVLKKTNDEH